MWNKRTGNKTRLKPNTSIRKHFEVLRDIFCIICFISTSTMWLTMLDFFFIVWSLKWTYQAPQRTSRAGLIPLIIGTLCYYTVSPLQNIFDGSVCRCVLLSPMCVVSFLCVCVSVGILLLWSAPAAQWSSRGRTPRLCSIEGQDQEAAVRPTLNQSGRESEMPEAQRPKMIRSDYSSWFVVEWMDR